MFGVHEKLLPLFQWMQSQPIAAYFLETTWSSPLIQLAHLLFLVMFAGSVFIVDIQLLGFGLQNAPLPRLAKQADKWMIWSFAGLAATGIPQVFSTALKQYYSPFFFWKMQLIVLGLLFTFTIRRRVALADGGLGPVVPRLVGGLSIVIWVSVTVWARLIGLFS